MKGTAYLIQATLIALWWIGLLLNQQFYAAFQFPGIGSTAFNAFLLPDITVVALLPVARAYTGKTELEYVVLGGFAFATLYCINATILTHGGYLSTTIMSLGLSYNLFLVFTGQLFRTSSTANLYLNGAKTILQIICVWTITLLVFPILLLRSFGVSPFSIQNEFLAILLFALFSLIGIYSAYSIVVNGAGTPLPLDQTQQLVTSGPYKYVRNPMAIAGIGQAIAVGLWINSLAVLIYALLGGLLWQFVVRPLEEKDMENRFGEAYEAYKREVKCWIPTFK